MPPMPRHCRRRDAYVMLMLAYFTPPDAIFFFERFYH